MQTKEKIKHEPNKVFNKVWASNLFNLNLHFVSFQRWIATSSLIPNFLKHVFVSSQFKKNTKEPLSQMEISIDKRRQSLSNMDILDLFDKQNKPIFKMREIRTKSTYKDLKGAYKIAYDNRELIFDESLFDRRWTFIASDEKIEYIGTRLKKIDDVNPFLVKCDELDKEGKKYIYLSIEGYYRECTEHPVPMG